MNRRRGVGLYQASLELRVAHKTMAKVLRACTPARLERRGKHLIEIFSWRDLLDAWIRHQQIAMTSPRDFREGKQAEKLGIEIARLRGELVSRDEAVAVWDAGGARIRAQLQPLPRSVWATVKSLDEPDDGTAEAIIQDAIEAALTELAGSGPVRAPDHD